jgi:two-component system response regulator RegA
MNLIIIDDDSVFLATIARRLKQAGYEQVNTFTAVDNALQSDITSATCILLDMQLEQSSGLDAIVPLKARFNPEQLIILTGYASIATTVEAMKRGATDYLAKPVGLADIVMRLNGETSQLENDPKPLSAAQIEREHIIRVLEQHKGNISATAVALNMHRRTLQRKLQKYSRGV